MLIYRGNQQFIFADWIITKINLTWTISKLAAVDSCQNNNLKVKKIKLIHKLKLRCVSNGLYCMLAVLNDFTSCQS